MSGSETDKVTRYDISFTNQNVEKSRTGFWVHYADCAAIEVRLTAAQGEITRYREALDKLVRNSYVYESDASGDLQCVDLDDLEEARALLSRLKGEKL